MTMSDFILIIVVGIVAGIIVANITNIGYRYHGPNSNHIINTRYRHISGDCIQFYVEPVACDTNYKHP